MREKLDFGGVTARLRALLPALSPKLRQAARVVLDRPDDVGLISMRRFSALAGVHPSTMIRLAQRLDCPSYLDFQAPFRDRLRQNPVRYAARARDLQARLGAETELRREMNEAERANIERTYAEIDDARLERAVERLRHARRVYLLGLRSCYPIAFFMYYTCRMFRDSVVLLDGTGGTFADDLRGVGAADCLLAISFAPYTRDTIRTMRYARQQGASVLAISDSHAAPLAEVADELFVVATDSPSFFHSMTGALSLAQTLVASMVAGGGKSAIEALDESERQLDSFGAYWVDGEFGRRAS